MNAIVIGATHPDSPWMTDLKASIPLAAPAEVWASITPKFELSSIRWASERFEEFVFLPESTLVLDPTVFDRCFGEFAGMSVDLANQPDTMYLAKFRSAAVHDVPEVHDKLEAVRYEREWMGAYLAAEEAAGKLAHLGRPMLHSNVFEERHGRLNMVVENEYLRRYKGAWDGESLTRAQARIAEGRI